MPMTRNQDKIAKLAKLVSQLSETPEGFLSVTYGSLLADLQSQIEDFNGARSKSVERETAYKLAMRLYHDAATFADAHALTPVTDVLNELGIDWPLEA